MNPASFGCLNRTSVGLKPGRTKSEFQLLPRPQSNQRGIETGVGVKYADGEAVPQSNQRGIETLFGP